MEQCVLHDKDKDECRASGLYCFYADPEMHINCIALNNAYKFGVAAGVRKCTNIVSKQLQDFKGKKNDNEKMAKTQGINYLQKN